MTLEFTSYTDSAMSDKLKQFFNRFKENNSYKYVEMIDSKITQSKIIEINYSDFPDDVKKMMENQPKERLHTALYRAIGEIFQIRHGSEELDYVKRDDSLKFRINNSEIFGDVVYSNPKLFQYGNYDKKRFEGDDRINNVSSELQKNYHFVTLRKTDEILLFDGKIYNKIQAETIIKEETEKLIPNCTTHDRREVINKIKAQTYTDLEKFDTDPNLITLENGILNIDTLELRPHSSEHLSRILLPVEYIKPKHENIEDNLKNTLFWKFLQSSFTVNGHFRHDDFEAVLEIIAAPIVKRHIDEKAFMFLGQGDNGKSVCLGYIESILGKNNVSNITLQDMADDKFMRANLDGMSANIFSDLEQNELKHTGKIKAITSGEGIEVQKKHQQGFTLKPFCKLMFSCNRFPKVYDQSPGFFRRWIIIKWERSFENDPERIEYLREKLDNNQEEKNLVFSCLVEIARNLNKNGKFTHSKNWKIIQREWNENADPLDDFATNYIVESDGHKSKRETYQFYKEVCYQKGESPLGMGQFSKAFAEYYEEHRDNKERMWLNIDFKRHTVTTMNDFDDS